MQEQYELLIEGLLDKGFGSVDQLFSPEEIADLRQSLWNHYKQDEFHLAGIGNKNQIQQVEEIRNDRIFWLDRQVANATEQVFLTKITDFINYLNRTCFTGIQNSEFHFAVYPPGSFYHKHVDRFENDDRRQFSMVMYLSESWEPKDGGRLKMYTETATYSIDPLPGRLVFFSADTSHEVEVSHQYRLSVTGWLKSR